jgi:hypothetical protein
MTTRRILLTVGGLFLLSAGSLSAQEMKVTCKDGTLSKGGQGACSSHGGIAAKTAKAESKAAVSSAKAATKTDAKMAKAETKATAKDLKAAATADEKNAKGATAMCKDNTYSHAKNRQGMCSGHGGVAKAMGK